MRRHFSALATLNSPLRHLYSHVLLQLFIHNIHPYIYIYIAHIPTYNYMHELLYPNRLGLTDTCTASGRQLMKSKLFTIDLSFTCNVLSCNSIHAWTDDNNDLSIYTKFPPNSIWIHQTFMSRVPKRDNFPGNNDIDPYTVTPSTRVTGSINDTRSCMHVVWLVWDAVMHI